MERKELICIRFLFSSNLYILYKLRCMLIIKYLHYMVLEIFFLTYYDRFNKLICLSNSIICLLQL